MPKKSKSAPEEIPLHEVVLKLMFEANKEKPARLDTSDLFWQISDPAVNERNVTEVLNWLVGQKRVEKFSGKYSLDRIEFLDQRKSDNLESGSENESSKSAQKEIPLHDVVLKLMFEANKEKPAGLSLNDLFWKISDPSVNESQVGDVLKWLLHHRRVENRAGMYSLDRFEFLDQTKADDSVEKVTKKEVSKTPVKKAPKIVIPPAPKETVIPKKPKTPKPTETKKTTNIPKVKEKEAAIKVPEPKEITKTPKSTETSNISKPNELIDTTEKVDDNRKVNTVLLLMAAVFFAYTCYLLISMSALNTSAPSSQAQEEIVSVETKLKQLSEKDVATDNKLDLVEKRLDLIQEITLTKSEQLASQNPNAANYNRLKSAITRLFLTNSLILLIFAVLFYRITRVRPKRK